MRAASHWPSREAAPLRRQPTARNGSTRMVLFPICSFFVCFKRELLFYVCMYFILFWHGWVFLAVAGLSLVAAIGSYSLFRCFSLRQLLLLQSADSCLQASVVEARGLQSPGSVVVAHWYLPGGMWDLPRPRVQPVSPTLAGGFFTREGPNLLL